MSKDWNGGTPADTSSSDPPSSLSSIISPSWYFWYHTQSEHAIKPLLVVILTYKTKAKSQSHSLMYCGQIIWQPHSLINAHRVDAISQIVPNAPNIFLYLKQLIKHRQSTKQCFSVQHIFFFFLEANKIGNVSNAYIYNLKNHHFLWYFKKALHIYTTKSTIFNEGNFFHSFEQFIQCKFFWKKTTLVNGLDLFKQASSQICQYKWYLTTGLSSFCRRSRIFAVTMALCSPVRCVLTAQSMSSRITGSSLRGAWENNSHYF